MLTKINVEMTEELQLKGGVKTKFSFFSSRGLDKVFIFVTNNLA